MIKVIKAQGGVKASPSASPKDYFGAAALNLSQMLASSNNSYWNKEGAAGVAATLGGMPDFVDQAKSLFKTDENGNIAGLTTTKKGKTLLSSSGAGFVGGAMDAVGQFIPESEAMSEGEHADLAKTAGQVSNTVENALIQYGGPWGAVAGLAIKGNRYLGQGLANMNENLGTSGNSKTDAVMSQLGLIGNVDAMFGKTMDELNYDKQTWSQIGSSYSGTMSDVKDASKNTGGRYGWLATKTGGYQNDLNQQNIARQRQLTASLIADEAAASQERANSTLTEAQMNQIKKLQGYNYMTRVAKQGIKLPSKQDILKTREFLNKPRYTITWEEPELVIQYEDGGKIKEKKSRSLDELIQYAKEQNPRFVQRMSEPIKYVILENGDHGTHLMSWEYTDDGQAMVFPTVMEDAKGNLYDYKEGALGLAKSRNDYLIMSPEEAEIFSVGYKQGWPDFFKQPVQFGDGGKMNLIPEGALHARLHHIEQEGITKKGIPVITEEKGGEVLQHAEIERNEIIFRLEVTQKLEELMKDGSDEAAIEAGKLLTYEILENTDDRTNLINEVE